MADERIAILGGRGMLGRDVAAACKNNGLDPVVLDLPDFDITNAKHVRAAAAGADAIVNCAAYTDVEAAESNRDLAFKVNGGAVGLLGAAAAEAGVWVLHISTDFVFDGRGRRPYTEADPARPVNAYGQSKLAGERLLVESGCSCCVLRLEWTYGSGGSNFITKLIERAKAGGTLRVVGDQIGSPTATTRAAAVILRLLRLRPEALLHYASAGYASRFEVAQFVFDKLDMAVDLKRCRTGDFPTAADRPGNSRFNCGRIKALLGEDIENWKGPLGEFLEGLI
jgi:dTDP-4-dehydrorhamnose reductase